MSSSSTIINKGRRHWVQFFFHHLFIAASLTSMVFLAKYIGMTKFIDGLTLSVSQQLLVYFDGQQSGERGIAGKLPKPALITISAQDYLDRNAFDATSPLSRDELAKGLELLFKSKPSHVFIDLDLAPGTSKYEGQDQLDRVLDAAAREGKIKLVIITPLLARADITTEWLRQRCQAGIMLAFNSVDVELGIVLSYSERYPSLGVVARDLTYPTKSVDRPDVCNLLDLLSSQQDQQAQRPDHKLPGILDLDEQIWRTAHREEQKYVRWGEWTDVDSVNWHRLKSESAEVLSRMFGQQVVFIGSDYDPKDRFQSPIGPKSGVRVHMAIASSDLSEEHYPMYLSEVLVGTLLGIWGAWCWEKHFDYRKAFIKRVTHNQQSVWDYAIGLALRGVLFITPAVTGLSIFLVLMSFSVGWLANGVWLNPAPLAIGMVLHMLMRSDETKDESENTECYSGGKPPWFLLHPTWVLIHMPLILVANLLMFFEWVHYH